MKRGMDSKGSLNLAIEVIVIIVIAMTLLGLGIAFVKKTLEETEETTLKVQKDIREQILESLRSSGKKLSISQEIQIERGKQKLETVGILNNELSSMKFGIKVVPIKKQTSEGTAGTVEEMKKEVIFFYNELVEKELSPTQGDVIAVTISTKSSASGNYLYKVNVYTESSENPGSCLDNIDEETGEIITPDAGCALYDTRSFFVRVV